MTLTTTQLIIFMVFTIDSALAVHILLQFLREKKPKMTLNPHAIVIFSSSLIWSIGMGLMSIQSSDTQAYFWRTFGIFGTFIFMISVQITMCIISDLPKKYQLFFNLISVLGIIVFVLYSIPGQTIFVHNELGTTFYFKQNWINTIYSLYFTIVSLNILMVTLYMAFKHPRKQIRVAGRNFIIVESCVFVGAITDMFMPSMGHPAFPGSAITHFWGVLIFYFTVHRIYESEIIISNMSEYIYYSLSIPVMVYDSNNNLKIINDSAKSFFSIRSFHPELESYKINEFFDLNDDFFDFDGNTISIRATSKEGTVCELSTNKIFDSYGDLIGHIIIVGDLTEHELVISKLEQARLAADSANMSKSLFLANMSHEIRTPMNAILGFSEIALSEDVGDTAKEYFGDIKRAGETLLSIINQVLDISKIEIGSQKLDLANYHPARIFKDIELIISVQANKKGLEFEMNIDNSFPSELYGDKDKIRQILINILNNSVKYTKNGRVTLDVSVLHKEGNDVTIQFTVSDTGVGIKEEDISKIFDKFHRVDSNYNSQTEGTGLGLSITKGLIEMMGGTIDVKSTYGIGSQFIVVLNQEMINDAPFIQETSRHVSTTAISDKLTSDKKFLAVDDNRVNLKVISKLLEKYSIQHETVSSGQDAIEKCKNDHYSVILLDQMMPVMDGIETLNKIKELPGFSSSETKIVALTANVGEGIEQTLLDEGFDAYISKPINIGDFEEVINNLFSA